MVPRASSPGSVIWSLSFASGFSHSGHRTHPGTQRPPRKAQLLGASGGSHVVSHPRTPPRSRPSAPLSPARVLRPSGLHAGRLSGAASWTGTSPPASPPRGRARGAALWPLNSCPLPFVLLRRLHWQTRSSDRPPPKARGSLSPARPPPFASRLSRTPRGSPAGRPAPGALPAAVPRPRVPPHSSPGADPRPRRAPGAAARGSRVAFR